MSIITSADGPQCKRCGTCCSKGGPALHEQDASLLQGGVLRAQDLCTFRPGELVRNEAEGRLLPLPAEIVKIAPPAGSRPDHWTCRFLTGGSTCFLYSKRPAECRALFCESPAELTAMAQKNHLDRKTIRELLQAPPWWDELIDSHEERCGYGRLSELAPLLEQDARARKEFLEIVEYDRAMRELITEREAALPLELDFLLGRPLLRTVIMYGLDARLNPDGGISLVQTGSMTRTNA